MLNHDRIVPAIHAYANLWPAPLLPAGLVIQMDRKLIPSEQRQLVVALADHATGRHGIYFFFACSMCDSHGCSQVHLAAHFRAEFRNEKMLRDSFTSILLWLRERTRIIDLPDGFTPQQDLMIRPGSDPRFAAQSETFVPPRRERRYGR